MLLQNPIRILPYNKEGKETTPGKNVAVWLVNPLYINTGGTDARLVYSKFSMKGFLQGAYSGARSCPTDLDNPPKNVGRTIHPHAGIMEPSQNITTEHMQLVTDQKAHLLIYGYIQYQDVFTATLHHERWCKNLEVNDLDDGKFSLFDLISDVQ